MFFKLVVLLIIQAINIMVIVANQDDGKTSNYDSNSALILNENDEKQGDKNIIKDVNYVRNLIEDQKGQYPVSVKFAGAEEAIKNHLKYKQNNIHLDCNLEGNKFYVQSKGDPIYGSQPFLSIKTVEGKYLHDNFDEIEHKKKWVYVFDEQTIKLEDINTIGTGTAGKRGNFFTCSINGKGDIIKFW